MAAGSGATRQAGASIRLPRSGKDACSSDRPTAGSTASAMRMECSPGDSGRRRRTSGSCPMGRSSRSGPFPAACWWRRLSCAAPRGGRRTWTAACALCRLDAATGRLLSETVIDHRDPKTGYQAKESIHVTDMPGALPDILSCDGTSVYLRHLRFDLCRPGAAFRRAAPVQPGGFPGRLVVASHLLAGRDEDGHELRRVADGGQPRARRPAAGARRNRRFMASAATSTPTRARTSASIPRPSSTTSPDRYNPRETNYQAFAINRDARRPRRPCRSAKPAATPKTPRASQAGRRNPAQAGRPRPPQKNYRWTQPLPILARAMILAEDRLFLAGPPDVLQGR